MFFILYIPPDFFCNTPVHISYLVVYESRSLRRRVYVSRILGVCTIYTRVRLFTVLAGNGVKLK